MAKVVESGDEFDVQAWREKRRAKYKRRKYVRLEPTSRIPVVSVITPTVPGREELLLEAQTSVKAQTFAAWEHLVEVDAVKLGPAKVRNRLALKSEAKFLAFLDDDDLLDPQHLEVLLSYAMFGVDVVYSDCRLDPPGRWPFNLPFDADRLKKGNYIPVTALVRRSTFEEVGGFPLDIDFEDWGLWLRILAAGGVFKHVPKVTWTYRHGAWDRRSNRLG